MTLTGLEGKVAVVTGAGRMRSIGRPIAVELARAGCDVVLTGTGRPPDLGATAGGGPTDVGPGGQDADEGDPQHGHERERTSTETDVQHGSPRILRRVRPY